ncbi:hypothetical protein SRB5_36590 [Streptomyces sp. RB5]|uniref:ABC3 transporter permease C-terminal domain-containing protein n=1 Tax=Streptomyces smaragdinus TaxID=2585196 RepID=A0A7K0CJC8_9ACTN|nr:FtsX-like permease family protein [Streptomyces smaragdinus]MQY13511.1 hypothetical protein [Streptomyces smaragdinus]
MWQLAVRMAGHRVTALIAVACAVLGGAVLVTATGVLAESGLRSQLPPGRLAGADVVVSADQEYHPAGDLPIALPERRRVPARLAGELAALPGVTAAVADVGFPAAVLDADGGVVPAGSSGGPSAGLSPGPEAAGHGWSSVQLAVGARVEGTAPGPGEVAVDGATARAAGARIGDRIRIVAAGRPAAGYRLTAVVDGAGILFADPVARRLSGAGSTADLIALRTGPGASDEVAAAARERLRGSGLVVTTGDDRGDVESPGAGASRSLLILLSGSLAGVVLLITGFVTASALAVAVAGQRRDLALMRAVGATPRQIRRLAATQGTVVAAVALVPGVALGYLVAGRFRDLLVGREVLPDALPLTVSPLPAVAAVVLLAGAVQVSARGAAWRASRMPATEAVAESRAEPRTASKVRTRCGLALIAGATAISAGPLLNRTPLGATATSLAGILGAIGLALAGPALVRVLGDAAARRLRPSASAPTWLAVSNVRGYAMRLSGVVSALAMAVVFVLTYTYAQTTVLTATADDVRAGTLAQQRLTAPDLGGLPVGALEAVRGTRGVRAAAPVGTTTVVWPYRQFGEPEVESATAMILTPDAGGVLDLDVTQGALDKLTGATIAVSADAAGTRGAGLGRRVRLVLGDGAEVTARVVAVYERGLGFGPVVLSHDLAAGHTTTALDQSLLARTDGGDAARRALAATVAAYPGLLLEPTGSADAADLNEAPPEVWINLAVIVVLLGYLLLSIANKLVATTAQRRGEIAVLRLGGTTPRQILAMMRREAAIIGTAAIATGVLLSAIPLALLGIGFLDRPWPAGPGWLLPALAALVAGTAFLTVELPARRALRTPPAEALSIRE